MRSRLIFPYIHLYPCLKKITIKCLGIDFLNGYLNINLPPSPFYNVITGILQCNLNISNTSVYKDQIFLQRNNFNKSSKKEAF